jgi:hypothetical protein
MYPNGEYTEMWDCESCGTTFYDIPAGDTIYIYRCNVCRQRLCHECQSAGVATTCANCESRSTLRHTGCHQYYDGSPLCADCLPYVDPCDRCGTPAFSPVYIESEDHSTGYRDNGILCQRCAHGRHVETTIAGLPDTEVGF